MKTYQTLWTVGVRAMGAGCRPEATPFASRIRPAAFKSRLAFTLIELLVVISIIAVLSAFAIPVLKSVARKKVLDRARAEMAQLETAIEGYKAAYGFYPPSSPKYNPANSLTWNNAYFNPLYYELLGTTNNNGIYQTLDASASIPAVALTAPTTPLGVSGFVNCSKPGAGEDAPAAKDFLPGLTSDRIGAYITNSIDTDHSVTLLLCSVGGPDVSYQPLSTPHVNPWRYVSPGVNNPNSYDLWVQLVIGGRTNLVCNWSKLALLNSPLP